MSKAIDDLYANWLKWRIARTHKKVQATRRLQSETAARVRRQVEHELGMNSPEMEIL